MRYIKKYNKGSWNSISERKYLKYFESNKLKYIPKEIIEDVNEILLYLSDNEYKYEMEYYITFDEIIKRKEWLDKSEFKNGIPDKAESALIRFITFNGNQPHSDINTYLNDTDKYKKSNSDYKDSLKVVLEHLISYINNIGYEFNVVHNCKSLYTNYNSLGRKEMKMDWESNTNISKFIDYFDYQGGSIEFCFFPKGS